MAPAGSREFLFTSESVTEGHPDKVADQISDGVLDEVLRRDPRGRVACEVLVTTGLVVVAGEITTDAYVDIPRIVRDTVREPQAGPAVDRRCQRGDRRGRAMDVRARRSVGSGVRGRPAEGRVAPTPMGPGPDGAWPRWS